MLRQHSFSHSSNLERQKVKSVFTETATGVLDRLSRLKRAQIMLLCGLLLVSHAAVSNTPAWQFIYKFNAASFPNCADNAERECLFGGTAQSYPYGFSQQYVSASSYSKELSLGENCIGASDNDPLSEVFSELYFGDYYYVVWNDQFYEQPYIEGCTKSCSSPWGHSKGVLFWDDSGAGRVIQVTTPAWPGAASESHPRAQGGNTLGCISLDDDIEVAQHFFQLKLSKKDVESLVDALYHASVVTDVKNPQLVNNGGPSSIQDRVEKLGQLNDADKVFRQDLSSGVTLLAKPSSLHVPPWQMVSAQLNSMDLLTATWWADPKIPSTTTDTEIKCWDDSLNKPGAVTIATEGHWQDTTIGLTGGMGQNYNHAKLGVENTKSPEIVIFGDMNQQGAIAPDNAYPGQKCSSSQNGRGGLFFVVRDKELAGSVKDLISGKTAAP